jgi:hypothetical protein
VELPEPDEPESGLGLLGVNGVAAVPPRFGVVLVPEPTVGDDEVSAVASVIAITPASAPAAPMLSPATIMRPRALSFRRAVIPTIVAPDLEGNLRIL